MLLSLATAMSVASSSRLIAERMLSTSVADWAAGFLELLGEARGDGLLQLETCIAVSYRDLMFLSTEGLDAFRIGFGNAVAISFNLGRTWCKDEHFQMEEKPPEEDGVGRGWIQWKVGAAVMRGNNTSLHEVCLEMRKRFFCYFLGRPAMLIGSQATHGLGMC